MVEPFNGYKSKKGGLYLTREAATREEVLDDLCEIMPEFSLIRPRLDSNLRALAIAMGPMLDLLRVPSEGPMPCCVNTPRGQEHHTDCPDHPEHQPPTEVDCCCHMGHRKPKYHRRDCPVYEAWAAHFPTGPQLAAIVGGRHQTGGIVPQPPAAPPARSGG